MKPRTLILRTAGTNCDGETAYAFERAGADCEKVHVNRLIEEPKLIDQFQIMALPGGFSYGDDIAAGRILANQIRHHLADALHRQDEPASRRAVRHIAVFGASSGRDSLAGFARVLLNHAHA